MKKNIKKLQKEKAATKCKTTAAISHLHKNKTTPKLLTSYTHYGPSLLMLALHTMAAGTVFSTTCNNMKLQYSFLLPQTKNTACLSYTAAVLHHCQGNVAKSTLSWHRVKHAPSTFLAKIKVVTREIFL